MAPRSTAAVLPARRRLTTTTTIIFFFLLRLLMPCSVLLDGAEGAAAPAGFWRWPPPIGGGGGGGGEDPYCLSWRVMVEANNAKGWRTVPAPCVGYVRGYMASSWGGQYYRDVAAVADQVAAYAARIAPAAADGLDAWVFDVDDTCLSNQPYYQAKQFGAYDPVAFRMWASRGVCPGIPAVRWLFQTLRGRGFRVFLVTGRDDEETLASATAANLAAAGFLGYDRLIMRL
jgi:acid phosphatase